MLQKSPTNHCPHSRSGRYYDDKVGVEQHMAHRHPVSRTVPGIQRKEHRKDANVVRSLDCDPSLIVGRGR